ncbi:MAG: hypothetical protein WCJ67_01745 [Thermoleophilia bacterium]
MSAVRENAERDVDWQITREEGVPAVVAGPLDSVAGREHGLDPSSTNHVRLNDRSHDDPTSSSDTWVGNIT